MRRAPSVKPAGVKLTAHQRALRENFAERLEAIHRIGTEVHDGKQIGTIPVLEIRPRVACEQRHVETRVNHRLPQRAHVFGVLAIRAVFVFHLHHEDRAALGDLQWPQHAAHFLQIFFRGVKIARIAGAQLDVPGLEQPPRETAHLPLRARIRAGAQDDP